MVGATVTMGRGVASAGGLEIVYEQAGRSGAAAVMLIHGGLENRTYYAAQIRHLSGARRVIAVDLRGHGESGVPVTLSIEDFEADVIAVAEAAGVNDVVLCGHSMAGGVVLNVAAARPDLVRGVVMLDAVIFFPEAVRRAAFDNLVPALATEGWLEALRGYFLGVMLHPNDPPEVATRVREDLGRARPMIARSFFESLFGPEFDYRERRHVDALERLRCPVLYVHATAPADLQRLQRARPDVLIGQVIGSGHFMMLSAPDQVNAMLDRFLQLVDAKA